MRQLGQLQKHAEDFKKLDAELIFVFREEQGGVEALKKIQERFDTEFILSLDLGKESSKAYSTKKMTFDNFVLDKEGKIVAVIDGTLRERATADQIVKVLEELEAQEDED